MTKVMLKSGSFENIEELSAELLAPGGSDDLQTRRKDVRGRSPVRQEIDKRPAESADCPKDAQGRATWIEGFVAIRDQKQSISEVSDRPRPCNCWPVLRASVGSKGHPCCLFAGRVASFALKMALRGVMAVSADRNAVCILPAVGRALCASRCRSQLLELLAQGTSSACVWNPHAHA